MRLMPEDLGGDAEDQRTMDTLLFNDHIEDWGFLLDPPLLV